MSRQTVLLVKENRQVTTVKEDVFGEWLRDQHNVSAWFTLRRYFARVMMAGSLSTLVLDARYSLPLNPYARYTKEELDKATDLKERCRQAFKLEVGQAQSADNQRIVAWTASIISLSLVLVLIIGAIILFS